MGNIDWAALRDRARRAARLSYAPYSGFRVGAAGLTDRDRIVIGCNVESASYGLTLCAECGVVSALHAAGGGTLVAISAVHEDGDILSPCGRCRQLLIEIGGPGLLVDSTDGPRSISDLLPGAFTGDDLNRRT